MEDRRDSSSKYKTVGGVKIEESQIDVARKDGRNKAPNTKT
jgi:hypothetical protein